MRKSLLSLLFSVFLLHCKKESSFIIPVLVTTPASDIHATYFTTGGSISSNANGGSAIIETGVVWSTIPKPSIDLQTKTSDTAQNGVFTSLIANLQPNTTYYYRAYANTKNGTGYGNELTITTPNLDVTTGLIAYYPFNGNANDESGNGNHGTGYGVTLIKDRKGKDNQAYYFSGANCETRIEANINTQSITTGFTISFWMQSDLSVVCQTPTLLKFGEKNSENGSRSISAERKNGVDYFVMNSSYGGDGYPYPINNEWRHITVTFDGSIENWYQNGTYIGSDKKAYFQPHLPGSAVFGRNNELSWLTTIYNTYKGSLDEIRIYDKVLNEEQIKYVSTL